ncbi:hypothetical protein MSG28_005243 [Choristoneura fumiferana]|uniref:Uncharacterized protein n=1 Tax=Choristoneura fumiferana TaxID=7141 RepID=A0ACC0JQF3_CHOFU|nr:hypothetical protein MSG28_005243 [Choristoneura fumiferana]
MQFLVLLSLLLMLRSGDGLSTFRCLLFKEKCLSHCPRGTHAYHTRCDRDTLSQRTCTFPYVYNLGYTCGWSRCDCNGEKVLDEESWTCVALEECEVIRNRRRMSKKTQQYRKLNLKEDDEESVPNM